MISISIYCTFICELRKENFYFFSSDFWEFLFFHFLCGLAFFTLQKIMALGVLASVNGIPIFAILSILATQLLSFLIAFKKRVLSCVSILGAKKTGTTSITFSIMVRSFQHFFAHNAAFICLLADANRLYGSLMYFFFITAYPFNAKLLMSLFLQKLSFSATIGISTLLFQQLFLMFALQLFCARMAIAFHRPVKPMMAIFMQLNRCLSKSSFVLLVRLKVAYYLQHFHVNNRYGITYGKNGNMSYASYNKSVVFYLKFLVFSCKLFAKN